MLEANDPILHYTPLWGAWQAEALIGEGSYGRVYSISREDIGGRYFSALKHIHIPRSDAEVAEAQQVGMDEASISFYFGDMASRIVSEIKTMYTLRGQPNIVSYEDHLILHEEGALTWDVFLRMELLQPLPDYLETHAFLPGDVRRLGLEICAALAACAKRGIIHRDIKDGNIFRTEEGAFKLGDFGIARTMMEQTHSMTMRGTPVYLAPEVFHGQPYDARVDLYSLGILLYKLLNGRRYPFLPAAPAPIGYGDVEKAFATRMQGVPVPPPAQGDAALQAAVRKACSYRPEDRYQTAEEMARALRGDAPLELPGQMADAPGMEKTMYAVGQEGAALAQSAYGSAPAPGFAPRAAQAGRAAAPAKQVNIWKKGMIAAAVLAGVLALVFVGLLCIPAATQPVPPHYTLPYEQAGTRLMPRETPEVMQAMEPAPGYVSVLCANLYEAPSLGSATGRSFPKYAALTISGEAGDWYYAAYGEEAAYFRKEDISLGAIPLPEAHPSGGLSLGYAQLKGAWVLDTLTYYGYSIELEFQGNWMSKTLRYGASGNAVTTWEGTYAIQEGNLLIPYLFQKEYLENGDYVLLPPCQMEAIEIRSIGEDTLETSLHTFHRQQPGQPAAGGEMQAV